MKKVVIILLITVLAAFGCTRIPASEETGVMPGKYEGLNTLSTGELKTENEKLKSELESKLKELEKLKDDYLSIAKNNDLIIKKLDEAESMLKELEDEGLELPKFNLVQTDKNSIVKYINERKGVLDKNCKDIEMIPLKENENIIIFYTVGYGENYNQIFMWEIGKTEPVIVEGANFNKDGNCKWLVQDKYIIIDTGKIDVKENKIIDVGQKKVVSTFETNSNSMYLIPGTASILMQKPKTDTTVPLFLIYDFINDEEKVLSFEFQDKDLQFNVDDENKTITFTGSYKSNDDIEYSVQAAINIDKLKDKYSIKTLEQSIEQKNPVDVQEELGVKEEGTV